MGPTSTCLLLLCAGWSVSVAKVVLVDMSYAYNEKTVSPPDTKLWHYQIFNINKGPWEGHGGIWFEMNNYQMNEHAGTHIDAPAHFNQFGWDPSEIPLDRLLNLPAVVIDISDKAKVDPHAQLEQANLTELLCEYAKVFSNDSMDLADLEAWERDHGKIPDLAAILVNSGWSSKYGTEAFMDIERDENGTITDMRFPSISTGAAQWLVDVRPNISCVGIDTTSIEYEPGYDYPTHRILLGKNIYAIENLANPDKLPAAGANVTILPIRIAGGSGAAARIVGMYDDSNGFSQKHLSITTLLAAMFVCIGNLGY